MAQTLVREFLSSFDDSRFPGGFLADYEALECLAHNEAGETLLVRNRQSGVFFVAKCYADQGLLSRTTESELLKRLRHSGLPAFSGEYRNETMLCVVREYVEGMPLHQYAAQNELTEEQAVSFGVQLCDILSYLHGQDPPVIHRDIKPQNLIVDARGKIRLIDFGISRVYDEGVREDTVCFGTKHFAAPEQYGFAQTDRRADIFSLGVLLGWLLTGETDVKAAAPQIKNARLRRVVQKCTAFAPERRYASAAKVKAALLAADGRRQKNALRRACGLLTCLVFLVAGFALGRYTNFTPAFLPSAGVSFEEPLIEQAVRLALHKQAGEPLPKEGLLQVTELYIYGDHAVDSYAAYEEAGRHMVQNDGTVRNGGIRSLQDLTKLQNLCRLRVALQNISDLAPLGTLSGLEIIELKHNPVADVSPLADLPALRELYVYDTQVADFAALAACPALRCLDAGRTPVTSVTAFAGLEGLSSLYLRQVPLQTLAGIERFSRLEHIGLSSVADSDLTPLLDLPQLEKANLDEALRETAEAELKQADFRIVFP